MLGKSPIKWRQHPDRINAVDWDVKHQSKQTNKNIGHIRGKLLKWHWKENFQKMGKWAEYSWIWNNNLYICNGRISGDETGAFTCIRGSVIDYLICNLNGLIFVNNFQVHGYSPLFSDVHCAISFNINVASPHINHNSSVHFVHKRWESGKKESFINNIDSNMVNELNLLLDQSHNISLNETQIDFFAESIKTIFLKSVKNSFKKYTVVSKKVKNAKPWFGLQCQKARKRYHVARKLHSVQKSDYWKTLLNATKQQIKSIIINLPYAYKIKYVNWELRSLRTTGKW